MREQIEEVIGIDASDADSGEREAGCWDSRDSGSDREADSRRRPATRISLCRRADFRFLVRPVSRGDCAGAGDRREIAAGAAHSVVGQWATVRCGGFGYQSPKAIPSQELVAGEVGFIYANVKNVADAKIGDTITDADNPAPEPLPGFEEIKPMVFAGRIRWNPTSMACCAMRSRNCN